jgi:primosomal protein N' (replication factor Y) (superfamily II helicase)
VKALVEKGILERGEREVVRTPFDDQPPAPPPLALHAAQQTALEAVGAAIAARRQATFLLHGVTGSGKTEVYIQALRQTLAQGRTGIVLVPEIALTPQTVRRFRAHFGDRVAVLHSRMSAGERFDAWRTSRAAASTWPSGRARPSSPRWRTWA